jgi:uncharacterized membrane protein
MSFSPLIAVHMTAAISATVIGPFAMWARLGMTKRPKLHRAFGYAWVTMMIVAATSAIFIRSNIGLKWHGLSPIHLLIIVTFVMLILAFKALTNGNIVGHRKYMVRLYLGACIVAGAFALSPERYLGNLLWN